MEQRKNLINGQWVGEDFVPNVNPSDTSDTIGMFARASAGEVDEAIAAAKGAQRGWGGLSAWERAAVLDRAGETILRRSDELAHLLAREEGKTRVEAHGEVLRAGRTFRYFAQEIVRADGETYPGTQPGSRITVSRRPVGVVGVITPWNFPIAIPAWKLAPALAFGNAVVFKPAELVPGSAWELVSILTEAGLPDGVLNLVMGRGSVVGERMTRSSDIAAISFTGSVAVGQQIKRALAESAHHPRLQMEMGGKNPLVVLDDADPDVAVSAAMDGAFGSTGQRCTASSRLIVQEGIYGEFVERLAAAASQLRVGPALDEQSQMGPAVSESQLDQDLDYIRIGQEEGAELVSGGNRVAERPEGYFLEPTLFAGGNNAMRINREEIFGPVACAIPVGDYDEALKLANDTDFGLSAGIITRSLQRAADFSQQAEAGIIAVNRSTAGTDLNAPFGGIKGSSFGPREQGAYARDFYTTVHTTYVSA